MGRALVLIRLIAILLNARGIVELIMPKIRLDAGVIGRGMCTPASADGHHHHDERADAAVLRPSAMN